MKRIHRIDKTDIFSIKRIYKYLSPEKLSAYNEGLDHFKQNLEKSDIFSLGLIYLRMILLLNDDKINLINVKDS